MTSLSDRNGDGHRFGAFARGVTLGAASLAALAFTSHPARAETRGYAVSWFYMAAESQKDDCPDGTNDLSEVMARKILMKMGKTPAEIDKLFVDFPNNMYGAMNMRGQGE